MKGNNMLNVDMTIEPTEDESKTGRMTVQYVSDSDGITVKAYEFDQDVPWTFHLTKFLELLEGVGYMNVRQRVAVVRNSDEQWAYDLLDDGGWHGQSVLAEELT
jgi:hypothetical protein